MFLFKVFILFLSCSLVRATELKIGFVNTQRIQRESTPAQKIQKKLTKEFAQEDMDLKKLAKKGQVLQAELDKEKDVEQRKAKEKELAILTRDFQRKQEEFRENLNLRQNEEFLSLLERVNTVIKKIAEREKFDLILQDAVYVSKKIDITDKVLKSLANDPKQP